MIPHRRLLTLATIFVSTISFGAEIDVRLAEASLRGDRAAVRTLLQQGRGCGMPRCLMARQRCIGPCGPTMWR